MDRIEANRVLGRKFFAEQDRLRGGPAPELCAAAYTARINGNPAMDRAGHEAFARGFYAGLPDARHEVETVIADADTAVVRFVIHGTHTGTLFGAIPPTGKRVAVPAHIIMTVRDGVVAELLGVFDEAGLLRQVGALPG